MTILNMITQRMQFIFIILQETNSHIARSYQIEVINQ